MQNQDNLKLYCVFDFWSALVGKFDLPAVMLLFYSSSGGHDCKSMTFLSSQLFNRCTHEHRDVGKKTPPTPLP